MVLQYYVLTYYDVLNQKWYVRNAWPPCVTIGVYFDWGVDFIGVPAYIHIVPNRNKQPNRTVKTMTRSTRHDAVLDLTLEQVEPQEPPVAPETSEPDVTTIGGVRMEIMYPLVNPRFKADITTLPPLSVKSLCQQALNHQLSNMVDASCNAWVRVEMLKYKSSNSKDATAGEKAEITKAITNWREANKEAYEAKRLEYQTETWKKILQGYELGTRPRLDPVEREYNNLVMQAVRARFASVAPDGVDFPKDDTPVTLRNGSVVTRTQMMEIIVARNGDEFRARAEAIVANRTVKSEAAETENF
jgi:gas vesicle protein